MTAPPIDPSRLEALRLVRDRERAALETATARMNADVEAEHRLRSEIRALGRRDDTSPEIDAKARERAAIEKRIGAAMADVEILRDRSQSATRLHQRCADHLRTAGIGGIR